MQLFCLDTCPKHPARRVYSMGKCKTCYGQSRRDAHAAAGLCRCGAACPDGRRQCDRCRESGKSRHRRQRALNPASSRESGRRGSERWGKLHPERRLLVQARHRATRKGFEFLIDESDIVIPERCPVLGLRLTQAHLHASPASPSLDRIDNARGYVKGNVWVISARANWLKGDASLDELRALVAALESKS